MNDDLHLRLLRRIARRARQALAGAPRPAERDLQKASDDAEVRLATAEARRRRTPAEVGEAADARASASGQREPAIADLRALASHASQRVALYRRRIYLGRGNATRLAELERIAAGAKDRLARALARRGS